MGFAAQESADRPRACCEGSVEIRGRTGHRCLWPVSGKTQTMKNDHLRHQWARPRGNVPRAPGNVQRQRGIRKFAELNPEHYAGRAPCPTPIGCVRSPLFIAFMKLDSASREG